VFVKTECSLQLNVQYKNFTFQHRNLAEKFALTHKTSRVGLVGRDGRRNLAMQTDIKTRLHKFSIREKIDLYRSFSGFQQFPGNKDSRFSLFSLKKRKKLPKA
jgi:hypothetical protein